MKQRDPGVTSFPNSDASAHDASVRLRLLGPPTVTVNGRPFTLSRRQTRALLYYLAANGSPVPRDQLSYLFWPEMTQSRARRNLTRLLSYLRQALPEDSLVSSQQNVSLDFRLAWCDSRFFERLCAEGQPAGLGRAVDLYAGPFLHGFSLSSSPEFDMWLSQEQGRYERLYLLALSQLVEHAAQTGDRTLAIAYAQRYLAVDDLAEEVHRRLISFYGAAGDRLAAQKQYEKCVAILERELGVAPLPETRAAFKNAIREPADQTASETMRMSAEPIWTTLPSLDLPLVGRDEAWKAMSDAFQRYHAGGAIFIAGEPGIGKSRLLQEFATNQEDRLVLTGNSHETTRELPYRPLTQALRLTLEQTALWSGIQPIWLAEMTRILPDLSARFIDLPKPVEVEPAQAQARLFEALSQVFLGLAKKKPILLCLDDLHWADEATLGWLVYFVDRLPGSDLCLLATYRNQEAETLISLNETLGRFGNQTTITLVGLTAEAIEGILRQIPETVREPSILAARLWKATAGNPFFALETIRSLWETGQLTSQPDQLPLPEVVQEAIRGRLARLEPIGRQILDAAAVLWPELRFEVLGQTAGRSEAEALDSLDQLLQHQILFEDPGGLRFQHELFRAVVYEEMNHWRRRSLHRRAAEAQVDVHQRDPDAVASQVARHYDAAGELESAIEWYARAGSVAKRQYANQEVLSLFRRAIDLLANIPEDRSLATGLYESLGDGLVIAGQLQEADAAYRSALTRCPTDDRLRLATLYQKLVHIYPPQGRVGESEAIYRKALDALGSEPGPLPAAEWWRAWLDIQLSRYETLYYQGQIDEMQKLALQVEPVLEQYGTPLQRVDYSGKQLMLTYRRKRFNLAPADLAYAAQAVEHAPIDDGMKHAYWEFGLGFGHLWAGLLPKANEYLLQALAEAEAMAYLPLQDQCLAYLVVARRLAGDVDRARLYHARSSEVAKRVGAPYYLGVAEANQAWLHFLDDQYDLAEASAQKALQRWQDHVYPFQWLARWPLLAINLARNELTAAVESAAAMLMPVQQRLPDDVTGALERAFQAGEAGKLGTTRRALEQALTLARDHNYL